MHNRLLKYICIVITGILVSCFFFPFEFTFLPRGMNTKMLMAPIGVFLLVINGIIRKENAISKPLLLVILMAAIVSLIGFVSCVYNNTTDYVYASYIVSFAVWICAAYVAVCTIRAVHGEVSLVLISNYLIAVCVFQCLSALAIDMIPQVKSLVDAFIVNIFDAAEKKRMYGIGASLDVAGTRFASVLIILTALLGKYGDSMSTKKIVLYVVAFSIIVIVGNMIGRTTTVGVLFTVVYMLISWFLRQRSMGAVIQRNRTFEIGMVTVLFFVVISVILYNVNDQMRENMRFGFEGFFSLAETGRWQTVSNDSLMHMWVFPNTLKTWLIGDGYFGGAASDPNFLGNPKMTSYYMFTDIGYCRFLFYFGLTGLLSFMLYFVTCYKACVTNTGGFRLLFVLLLLLNFAIWIKVATDIFPVFAIFLCLRQQDGIVDGMEELSE